MSKPLPKVITTLGVICVALGLSWAFLEGPDFASKFLSDSLRQFIDKNSVLFFMMLPVGILLSAGGTIAWTHKFSSRKKLKVAGFIFFAALLSVIIASPANVHSSGMLFFLTAVCAAILSIVLAVIAFVGPDRSEDSAPNSRNIG